MTTAACKLVRLLKRRSDLGLAQFKQHWLASYAPIEREILNHCAARRVVASFSTGEVAMGAKEPPFDGMDEIYFDSLADAQAMLSGPAHRMLREAEQAFVDAASDKGYTLTDEHLMSARAGATMKTEGQLKIVRTVYRRHDLNIAQFKEYWLRNHAKLEDKVIEMTPVQRIVATFAAPEAGTPPDWEGMVELYFASVEDIRAIFAGPVPAMMRKDEENFVQMDAPAVRAVTEEYLIAGR